MDEAPEYPPHHRKDIEIELVGDQVRLRIPGGEVLLTEDEALSVSSRLFETTVRATEEDPEAPDWKRVPMQYLRLGIEEEIESKDVPPRTGMIHCWIKSQTRTNALHVACGWTGDDGWYVTELMEQRPVSRADFENDDRLQYYEQALIDEEIFLFEIDGAEEDEGPADGE